MVVSAVVNFTSSDGRYYSVLIVARVARDSCVSVVFSVSFQTQSKNNREATVKQPLLLINGNGKIRNLFATYL